MTRPAKDTCLCFVLDEAGRRVLLIAKKRGMGAGKWNGPGGKLEAGETSAQAAVRETREETGISPVGACQVGLLEFRFAQGSSSWDNNCRIFRALDHAGTLGPETDECAPAWVPLNAIPYEQMWEDDRSWLPSLLAGRPFHRVYVFGADDVLKGELVLDPA